ncbi:hypothetical protein B0H16DRAFT_1684976 [Mycena metata]|uniref:Uncharacterized protein n=1 Tax=Mycena metata TaxID=1033252 RepID=A0AAD7NTF1_9AGAR|nr:hypothetical protein B0H16DRAFT_1684976 [Mycena metata]
MPLSQGVFGASGPPPNNSHFTVILGEAAQYLCVWAATGILDGAHTLQVDSGGTPLLFDQFVYTSNDPDPTLAPSMPTSAPSASTAIPASIGNSHKHAPVGAMAGGVVGGIAAILAILGANHTAGYDKPRRVAAGYTDFEPWTLNSNPQNSAFTEEPQSPTSTLAVKEPDGTRLAEQVRFFAEHVEKIQRTSVVGSSSTSSGSDNNTGVRRSLSTMKRDETRSLMSVERDSVVGDMLVHTDSGVRLSAPAGRVMDELPPTYEAGWGGFAVQRRVQRRDCGHNGDTCLSLNLHNTECIWCRIRVGICNVEVGALANIPYSTTRKPDNLRIPPALSIFEFPSPEDARGGAESSLPFPAVCIVQTPAADAGARCRRKESRELSSSRAKRHGSGRGEGEVGKGKGLSSVYLLRPHLPPPAPHAQPLREGDRASLRNHRADAGYGGRV